MSQAVLEEMPIEAKENLPATEEGGTLYYGWIMVPLSMLALIASAPGQTFGVSIFNEPLRLSLKLSHGQLAAAYMLGTLLGALPITYIGHQMDRYGLRRTMLGVITMFSLTCLLMTYVQGWFGLVVGFGFLRMLGPGALAFLSGNTLSFWFEKRLGMVEGLRQLGMAVAMVAIPSLNLWLVTEWGWQGAYGILGVGIWLLLFPLVALFYRNHPADVGQLLDNGQSHCLSAGIRNVRPQIAWGLTLAEALRSAAFWIVTGGTALFGLIHTAIFFCLVPIFAERGLTARDAALTLTMFAVCLATMQLIGGILADRIRASYLLLVGMTGLSLAVLVLYAAHSLPTALLAGGALGISQGIFFGTSHPLWARYFGRLHLGKIRGMLMTINVAASSLGPLFAGLTRDWQGNFTLALVVFAIAPLPFGLLSLLVAPPKPRAPANPENQPATSIL